VRSGCRARREQHSRHLGRFAPELLETEFAREMWAQFEQGELTPDSKLTGIFARDDAGR
jgi:RIO kinase 1